MQLYSLLLASISETLFSYLRFSYQGRTFLVRKTYVLATEDVHPWCGEHKTQPSKNKNRSNLLVFPLESLIFVIKFTLKAWRKPIYNKV